MNGGRCWWNPAPLGGLQAGRRAPVARQRGRQPRLKRRFVHKRAAGEASGRSAEEPAEDSSLRGHGATHTDSEAGHHGQRAIQCKITVNIEKLDRIRRFSSSACVLTLWGGTTPCTSFWGTGGGSLADALFLGRRNNKCRFFCPQNSDPDCKLSLIRGLSC